MRIFFLCALAGAAALVLSGPTGADNTQLVGSVGPGFSISLQDAAGNAVTQLDPGTYTLLVHDQSDFHNFDLSGPGVKAVTDVEFVGDKTFTITIAQGTYTFVCDVHSGTMHGKFFGGTPPATNPPPSPPKAIAARVGPGKTISFARTLAKGKYSITVRDLSKADNLHLKGPGVDRKTGVAFRGTVKWAVTLKAGTYRVGSDAHKTLAHSVKVS
jgi:plastocyanin